MRPHELSVRDNPNRECVDDEFVGMIDIRIAMPSPKSMSLLDVSSLISKKAKTKSTPIFFLRVLAILVFM
jgi:hypothetical protein